VTQKRQDALQRLSSLRAERSSWTTHWQELADNLSPRAMRIDRSARNDGGKKHQRIVDNTGQRALRTLSAGMMSGMTSPARPWFRLGTPDLDLMEYAPVKEWLTTVRDKMLRIFAASNTYMTLHNAYENLGSFGTSLAITLPDFDNVIHHYDSPIGEYMLGTDYRGKVNTAMREFEKTVAQLVGEFGYDHCSKTVRTLYDAKNYDAWVPIAHIIEPRTGRDLRSKLARDKAYTSCYFELGADNAGDQFLREGGFDTFPGLAPRWHRVGGDVYGQSPGMDALGDLIQLRHQQLRKGNVIDYQTKPPLQVPVSLKNQDTGFLPGSVVYVDQTGPQNAVKSAFDVRLDLSHLGADILDTRERIRGAFFTDLFLMMAQFDAGKMTATEVALRNEEKLLMLGPVLERLHAEQTDPLVEDTFAKMIQAKGPNGESMLPPAPKEMQGQDLNVEMISMLAQAQRAIGVNSIDRFVGNIGQVAQFKPDVLDKFDADRWADDYADMLGIEPELIVSNEKVAFVRKQRAQAQAQAAQAEQQAMKAEALAKAGTVATGPDANNAGNDILNMFSGYNSPSGVEA